MLHVKYQLQASLEEDRVGFVDQEIGAHADELGLFLRLEPMVDASSDAARASDSISLQRAASSADLGATQEPPTHATLFNAR